MKRTTLRTRILKKIQTSPLLQLPRTWLRRFTKRKTYKQTSIPTTTKIKYFILGTFFSFFFFFSPLLTLIFMQDVPSPHELSRPIAQTTKIYDRNKILLYEIFTNQNRTIVQLSTIPPHLKAATLAIEDKNFYKHPGFDVASMIRALKENVAEGKPMQGGSTITQQLIKSSLLTSEKKLSRKIKEIILAFWTERLYSKDEILEMYFNQVPYGGTAWGVEAASEVYFGKPVTTLTLAESAFLAGLTQAPSLYSPYDTKNTLWKKRQAEVLARMVSLKFITKDQAQKAAQEQLRFKKPVVPIRAPHFVMYIKELLIKNHGLAAVEKGGLTVITTLDITKQEKAQIIVAEEVANAASLLVSNGALVITDPKNGDILAMVGSKDFTDPNGGNFNVTTALRQPGSTVKVITYATALMHGFTAASIIDDSPVSFPDYPNPPYTPVNYDGRYHGRVTVKAALANSYNIPAVKTLDKVGIPTMVQTAQAMGITTWNDPKRYGLSITLGGAETTMLDMATVFGTLSNQGKRVTLNPIISITDQKGKVLEQKKEAKPLQAIPPGVAAIISHILSDVIARAPAFGTNSILTIPEHTVSVKTGTSDNKRDNWTIGYTPEYVVTVWVGNNDNTPMSQYLASGITGAAPIWSRTMHMLLAGRPDIKQQVPEDVVVRQCGTSIEYFLKGTERNTPCLQFSPTPAFIRQ